MKGRFDVGMLRSMFLPVLVGTALAALGANPGLGAEGETTPTAPSATSEPAQSLPSQPPTVSSPSQTGNLPTPLAASPSPPTGNAQTIVDWLNQTVRLRDTVQAFDQPSSDGKVVGGIRAGAEVKAIGVITGRQWVQIELPDQR
jgi:hypothetical protein